MLNHMMRPYFHFPSYTEDRGDSVLCVWSERTYWAVLNRSVLSVLKSLDGNKTIPELIKSPERSVPDTLILESIALLSANGVITQDSKAFARVPLVDEHRIKVIYINMTLKCNLKCTYCYNANNPDAKKDDVLNMEALKRFIDQAAPMAQPTANLLLVGGEPLLETDKVLELANYARRYKLTTVVSTNGTTISEKFCRDAQKVGLQVQVSIDGHNSAIHDSFRGKGVFDSAIEGVKRLVSNHVFTILYMVCDRKNIDNLQDYLEFASLLHVDQVRFYPVKLMGGATHQPDVIPPDEVVAKAYKIFSDNPRYIPLLGRDYFSHLFNVCRYSLKRSSCGIGSQMVLIDTDGSVYPCLSSKRPNFKIGNICDADFDLQELWRNSDILKALRKQVNINTPSNACFPCALKGWCLGGCKGETFGHSGALSAQSPHCAQLKRAILDSMWMIFGDRLFLPEMHGIPGHTGLAVPVTASDK